MKGQSKIMNKSTKIASSGYKRVRYVSVDPAHSPALHLYNYTHTDIFKSY